MKLNEIKKASITENIADISNLHGRLSSFIEHNGAQIEDWQDQARLMFKWLMDNGAQSVITAKAPEQTTTGDYLHRIHFIDTDGMEKWLAYTEETGVGDISNEIPDPSSYS